MGCVCVCVGVWGGLVWMFSRGWQGFISFFLVGQAHKSSTYEKTMQCKLGRIQTDRCQSEQWQKDNQGFMRTCTNHNKRLCIVFKYWIIR